MSHIDQTFISLCSRIFQQGKEYTNKNRGVSRLQIPSFTLRHDFNHGFPAISLKKLQWKAIVGELIWFLRGDNDVAYLNSQGIKIWNKDAYNWYLKHLEEKEVPMSFEQFEERGTGSVGQNYSVQWRNFNGKTDQIKELIQGMKKDIMSSRLKVNAWNPSELNDTALPPCHSEFQVIGVPLPDGDFGFELHWNQRSVDVFLGLPFNIASYGLLAKILEAITGYKALAIEGTLKCVHFYDNQYEAALTLMKRNPYQYGNCKLKIHLPESEDLDSLFHAWKIEDFVLKGYEHFGPIKVEMLAPKSLKS